MSRLGTVLASVVAVVLCVPGVGAKDGPTPEAPRFAALALPVGPTADWQQWDSFLTNVVKKLGEGFQPAQRDQLVLK